MQSWKNRFTSLSLLTPSTRIIFPLHRWKLSRWTLRSRWRSSRNEIRPVWIGRAAPDAFISTCASVAGRCTINSVPMLFLALSPHRVQCTCFRVTKLFKLSSAWFQIHFTAKCARLFAFCPKATTRISVVLKRCAIHTGVDCLTLHPKAWKKILLMINLDNYNNYVIYNRQ